MDQAAEGTIPAITALVQARMGSSRLPGKVLRDLAGKPMLGRVIDRLRRTPSLVRVVVATSTLAIDDVLAEFCQASGWPCFRGNEQDVLDRFYQAALAFPTKVVVRVTADCPLIDPDVVEQVVQEFLARRDSCDYASNVIPVRTYPRGLDVEVFSFQALKRAWEIDQDPASREHVTPSLYRRADLFRTHGVRQAVDQSQHRWTVDTPEDFALVERIYQHFKHDGFKSTDVLELLDQHPDWSAVNAHIQQKVA